MLRQQRPHIMVSSLVSPARWSGKLSELCDISSWTDKDPPLAGIWTSVFSLINLETPGEVSASRTHCVNSPRVRRRGTMPVELSS